MVLIIFAHFMAAAEQIIPLDRLAGYLHNNFCDISGYYGNVLQRERLCGRGVVLGLLQAQSRSNRLESMYYAIT